MEIWHSAFPLLVQKTGEEDIMKELRGIFAELHIQRQLVTDDLLTEAKSITQRYLATQHSNSLSLSDSLNEVDDTSIPEYVAEAYPWLLQHLHNPYPSNAYKSTLAKNANVALKTVNVWFANVRRRIGWTAISKRFFDGNRPETVEYAHRVFKRKKTDTSPDEVIAAEFLSIKAKAESLYRGKLTNDSPESVSVLPQLTQNERPTSIVANQSDRKRKRMENISDVTGFPEMSEELHLSKMKRHRIATDELNLSPLVQQHSFYDIERSESSRTRFRTPSSSSTQSSSRSPTPMPSTPRDDFVSSFAFDEWAKGVEIDNYKLDESPLSSPIEIPAPTPTRSRKRRLSESDEQPSKRPRGAALPRLHTVSDSYLLGLNDPAAEATLSKLDFTLPEPAALTELPQIEVPDFLQVWPSEETRDSASSSCAELPNEQPSAPSTLLLESEHDGISNELSAQPDATDLNDFDKFLEQLAADPSLMLPTLPQNIPEIPWFDTSSNTEYDLSALDLPLATSTPVKKGSRCREASLDLFSIPHNAIPEGEDDIFSIDKLQDIPAPISPVDSDPTKVQSSVGTTDSSKSSPETIEDSECSREDKLQKLQMLMAEVEKLQKEIGS